jgi:hypothetical protein
MQKALAGMNVPGQRDQRYQRDIGAGHHTGHSGGGTGHL